MHETRSRRTERWMVEVRRQEDEREGQMMEVLEMEMCERVSEEMEMTSASRGGGMAGGAFSFLIARVFIDFGGGIFLAGRTSGCIWVSAPDEDEDEDLSGAFCDC